ncbi:MAG: hypothetical protein PHI68_06290, partial [Candidatus Cloacimonetes bacterium]|nr:hypothetical protein [Candidatus Cloacimonadota bacterium]
DITGNGALKTEAELYRSMSYLELGKLAEQRQSIDIAISFFKLANSSEADERLAEIYKAKADKYLSEDNIDQAMENYTNIWLEIPSAIHIPEVLFRRIRIYWNNYGNYNAAWTDYKRLFERYPNNTYEIEARAVLKGFSESQLEYARLLTEQAFFEQSLTVLFEQERYPVADQNRVSYEISRNYRAQAEMYVMKENYIEADRLFRIALQYHPQIEAEINARLKDLAGLFIKKGDSYVEARDFTNALLNYQKSYEIIPNYELANQAIARMRTIQENIKRAAELMEEGEKAEIARSYSQALSIYREAVSLHNLPEYRIKVSQMQNLVEAERNPIAFTQRIINEYLGGRLNQRIQNRINELLKKYNRNQIRDSGWKILVTGSQHRYEARFDIVTPQETFFYVWIVNLRDRSLTALNKISEEAMQ